MAGLRSLWWNKMASLGFTLEDTDLISVRLCHNERRQIQSVYYKSRAKRRKYGSFSRCDSGGWRWHAIMAAQHAEIAEAIPAPARRQEHDSRNASARGAAHCT